ncbi:UxaA family hydrolase [Paenibacillus sp.]|uniref:UxaA family hydrolase n=1 Tax=Paenibacillus sp. TaxID=58172 RepID=UPI002D56A001|nr:UxaA family hydrolase [Paenibacillus sp.]HZG56265.1 UxaA family hydrolase [Paenibacillus sp.]
MAGDIQAGADAIKMHANDHVATMLRDAKAGETLSFAFAGERLQVTLKEDVAFGHKVALVDIPEGTHVKKYGETIGRATASIPVGSHVHVHNIEGIRGRGDQAGKGESA